MSVIFNILASLTSLYLLLIFIRIILTWFGNARYGAPGAVLCAVTDPYLDWFRRFPLKIGGFVDASPIIAMAVLSVLGSIFRTLAGYGFITVGLIAALLLGAVWSAVSFLLFLALIALGFRLFAHINRRDMSAPFWRVVDAITQPILFQVRRFSAKISRNTGYTANLIVAICSLFVLWIGGGVLIAIISLLLKSLPV
jgi:YggT family protein